MELRQTDYLILKSLLLLGAGIILTQAFGLESITSVLFTLTFPLTVLLWLRTVRKKLKGMDLVILLIIILSFVNVLLDVSLSGGSLSFAYVKKVVMFAMSLLFLQSAYRIQVNREFVRFVDRMADCLTLFLIAMYYFDYSGMHMINGISTRYLTFGFSNPNTTGMFLICLYMLELYRVFRRERWYKKLVHIGMAVMLAWFVLDCESRNCLLVLAIFTVFCIWLEFRSKRRLRISRGWATLIAWFPLIFAGVYMAMVYMPWIQRIFGFLVGEGKGLDSRMRIWLMALEEIGRSPLIGAYYTISGGMGGNHLHNSHLDIAGSYGIPVLIMVCTLLTRYLHQKGRYYESKESFSHVLGFACAVMLGLGESALFSGGLGIYIFAGTLLILSRAEDTVE